MADERADRELLLAYRNGDERAAEALFTRYYELLVATTRKSLSLGLANVEAPSDIVQSVFRSVFRESRDNSIQIDPGDTLWPLLAKTAINKVRSRARHWQRQRRDFRRNVDPDDTFTPLERGPSSEDIVATTELVASLLKEFSPTRRSILEMVLQGYKGCEIAEQLKVSERTVYNTRKAAAESLERLNKETPG